MDNENVCLCVRLQLKKKLKKSIRIFLNKFFVDQFNWKNFKFWKIDFFEPRRNAVDKCTKTDIFSANKWPNSRWIDQLKSCIKIIASWFFQTPSWCAPFWALLLRGVGISNAPECVLYYEINIGGTHVAIFLYWIW